MSRFATLRSGLRTIDLHAFTGRVVDQQRSSVTEVTRHHANAMLGTTTRTSSWNKVFLQADNGEEKWLEVPDQGFAARAGQMASIIWGIRAGKEKGDYLALINHETGAFQCIRKAVNDHAGPPFYNMLLILLVIVGCVGLVDVFGGHYGSALFFFAVGGGGIAWIWRRQKQFMAKIKAAALAMPVSARAAE
ncbi:MAG TPA: hypothetical protein VHM00_01070 [Caldimonas sp.]|jgi:hypothetical protein|nr:hypothetical protein [Caldimonas sp.]HEX2539653.1 hypothetical protein [Caldimonas sp.]